MVLRPNLDGDSLSSLHLGSLGRGILPSCCAHSGDSIGDREFDSDVSYFLILINTCSIFVCTHTSLGSFIPFTRLVMSGKMSVFHSGQSLSIPPTHNLCHCLWWALSTLIVCYQSTIVHLGPRLESWPT